MKWNQPHFSVVTKVSGVTLLEALVTVLLLAILATLAMPSFQELLLRYRVRVASEQLISSLLAARSHARSNAGAMTLRVATTAGGCFGASSRWDCGWFLFHDVNGDGVHDSSETVVFSQPALSGVVITNTRNGVHVMRYNRWGHVNGLGATGFVVRPASVAANDHRYNIVICISSGGRFRTVHSKPNCS